MVREELLQLSDEDQHLLRLIFQDGKTHRESAESTQCPAGSIHARVERARDDLRRRLRSRGISLGILLLMFLLSMESDAADLNPVVLARDSSNLAPARTPWHIWLFTLSALAALGGAIQGHVGWFTSADTIVPSSDDPVAAECCTLLEDDELSSCELTANQHLHTQHQEQAVAEPSQPAK